ncbi:MAG: sulfatase-like hydrolase/transferase [Myxococcota bacterium]|nr:sulfatase-like hydrolase/transferase [Myxococcota bacterium]
MFRRPLFRSDPWTDPSLRKMAGVMLALVMLTGTGCSEGEFSRKSNDAERGTRVVLITLDTMRRDTLEGRGSGESAMPLTQAWARRGLTLDRHYAASSTTDPTHASLMTGLSPWQHGVSRNGLVLDGKYTTLAEIYSQNDYRTGAVVSSFPVHRTFGFEQGFEKFDDVFEIVVTQEWSGKLVPKGAFYTLGDSITSKALSMIDELAGPRQFFWFHYFDLHEPYGDAAKDKETIPLNDVYSRIEAGDIGVRDFVSLTRERYEDDARVLDKQLDRLFTRLAADADRVDTHILVVSDHGESFGEDNSLGHGKRLGDELIHVPCFLISPSVSPGRSSIPVGSVDVPVTLLALSGLDGIEGLGRDVTQPLDPERTVFGMRRTFEKPFRELRLDGEHHLIDKLEYFYADAGGVTTGNEESVVRRPPSTSFDGEAARALFGVFTRELSGKAVNTAVDDETRAALEALGYVQ